MYDSFVQETQGERKGLLRCFDFRKSLEKAREKSGETERGEGAKRKELLRDN